MKNDAGDIIGLSTQRHITTVLTSFKVKLETPATKVIQKEYKLLHYTDSLKYLPKAFQRYQYVLVESKSIQGSQNVAPENERKFFICEHKHLLQHFLKSNKDN